MWLRYGPSSISYVNSQFRIAKKQFKLEITLCSEPIEPNASGY